MPAALIAVATPTKPGQPTAANGVRSAGACSATITCFFM
jgi:hypothetical protein